MYKRAITLTIIRQFCVRFRWANISTRTGATFDEMNTGFVRIKSCVTCIIVCIDDPPSSFILQCANGCQLPTHSQHARLDAFESCFMVGSQRGHDIARIIICREMFAVDASLSHVFSVPRKAAVWQKSYVII